MYFEAGAQGSQNQTGEVTGLTAVANNSNTGNLNQTYGLLASAGKSSATGSITSEMFGIRVDRHLDGGAGASGALFGGIHVNSPSVTTGSNCSGCFSRGIIIDNQNLASAANSLQIESNGSGSGNFQVWSDNVVRRTVNLSAIGSQGLDFLGFTYTGGDLAGFTNYSEQNWTITPSANITQPQIGHAGNFRFAGTHTAKYIIGLAGYVEFDDSTTATEAGSAGLDGEFGNYSTTTVPELNGVQASGGTGSGSTTTLATAFHAQPLWQTDGAVTTFVAFQADDVTANNATNAYAFRYSAPHGDVLVMGDGTLKAMKTTVSNLPTCNAAHEGGQIAVTDSNTATWGATISGTGANHVLAYCDGTNWTVMGK